MRLRFIVNRRVPPVPSPVLLEVYRLLEGRGFLVEDGIPEETLVRADLLEAPHDLYVLKSHTELALSLAGSLDAQGARTLNPYRSCMAAQDKIVAFRLLLGAGIPVPATWVTEDLRLLREVVEARPVIVKPHRGHRGHGVHIVRSPRDLDEVPAPEVPVVIQEYVEGEGEDLKVYVVGDEVFAVRKVFSADSFARPGRPSPVDSEIRDIALCCGRVFGLGLYGLDLIEGSEGPIVVDVNYFPGYKGVPDPAPLIADYVAAFATGEIDLAPLDPAAAVHR